VRRSGAVITKVDRGSPASLAGLCVGDEIVRINGEPMRDIIDYRYAMADEDLLIEVRRPDGSRSSVRIVKELDEDLGLEFADVLFDGTKICENDCEFCFVKQLPRGVRPSLRLRDDDYRLSFLYGNFITLTNMTDGDLERVKRWRISPLYVSVHTSDPELRARMFRNSRAAEVLERLRDLVEAGIEIHAQVVLVPGWNDGAILERTIDDLAELWPGLRSLGIVPVGLTKFGLEKFKGVRPFATEDARRVLDTVLSWQRELLRRLGSRVVFPADELLVLAEEEVPPIEEYEDLWQLENGIGMLAVLRDNLRRSAPGAFSGSVVVTGTAAAPFLRSWLAAEGAAVYSVTNEFFGPTVTVSGLLTGRDLIRELDERVTGRTVILPDNMLSRREENTFLDGLRVEDVAAALSCEVKVVDHLGRGLVRSQGGRSG